MKTKERTIGTDPELDERRVRQTESLSGMVYCLARLGLALAGGFFLTDVRIGAALSPFSVSLVSAVSPFCGAAVAAGAFAAMIIRGSIYSNLTELISMIIMLVFGYVVRRKRRTIFSALTSSAVYIACALAVSAGNLDAAMCAAILVRGAACGAMTAFFIRFMEFVGEEKPADDTGLAAPAAVYILVICALCDKAALIFDLGRIFAGFTVCVAARKFGSKGGSALGIAAAAAFLLSDPAMGRCGAMLAFAGMVSGMYAHKGKHSVNIAFIVSCFAITAAAGLPSGTPEFIADMGAAAIMYCFIPERLYMPFINRIGVKRERRSSVCSEKLGFAAGILEDVGNDVESASDILAAKRRSARLRQMDSMGQEVRAKVCGEKCVGAFCCAVGGCGSGSGMYSDFSAAQVTAESKGVITQRDLPAGFEGCTKKADIVSEFNSAVRIRQMQQRSDEFGRRFLEGVSEQLSASGSMMTELAREISEDYAVNESLSETASAIAEKCGVHADSLSVMTDREERYFIECYVKEHSDKMSDSDFYDDILVKTTDRLSALIGEELDMPVVTRLTAENSETMRIRWCSRTEFTAECTALCFAAESGVSGDSHISFEDGKGNFYVILSDGMGRGGRAAAQSSMTVSILKRLIIAGICEDSAIRLLNTFLTAADGDEVFTTADLLKINCYNGSCDLIKLGSAATYLRTADENGEPVTRIFEAFSSPLGILTVDDIPGRSFYMDEDSRLVLVTDGITSECSTYICELLENEKLTSMQTAERIMAFSDEGEMSDPERMRLRDDKTAAVIRLYRRFP
ncbi:MAG: SpoIIE family protein phosphatase [Huintestinicola sp.]